MATTLRKRIILSIDGGGVRGIIAAAVLKVIEDRLQRPISSIFDLIVGTSTGGMIAAALCLSNENGQPKYRAQDMIKMYEDFAPFIFQKSLIRSFLVWFEQAKYSEKNIDKFLCNNFGQTKMGKSLTNLMLTSYDILNNEPFFIRSWKEEYIAINMCNAVRATSAAPTFFSPLQLFVEGKERVLIDGGIFAANPSTCAFACCPSLFNTSNVLLLSISTGYEHIHLTYRQARHYGRLRWAIPLIKFVFSANLKTSDYQLSNLLFENYFRVNTTLKWGKPNFDNGSKSNIEGLKMDAARTVEINRDKILKFCELVSHEI